MEEGVKGPTAFHAWLLRAAALVMKLPPAATAGKELGARNSSGGNMTEYAMS